MNQIILKGIIRDIEYSHTINGIDYEKANIIITKQNGQEDILALRFKKFSNHFENGQEIELLGNIRSFSEKGEDGKNKVHIYIFTYFDMPPVNENDEEIINEVKLDGRICKIEPLSTTNSGKYNIHFTLANNIFVNDKNKINNYIPICCWGKLAQEAAKLNVSDQIQLVGQLHSRQYRKVSPDGELEIRTAYEVIPSRIEVL